MFLQKYFVKLEIVSINRYLNHFRHSVTRSIDINKHIVTDKYIVNFTKLSQKIYQFCRSISKEIL